MNYIKYFLKKIARSTKITHLQNFKTHKHIVEKKNKNNIIYFSRKNFIINKILDPALHPHHESTIKRETRG